MGVASGEEVPTISHAQLSPGCAHEWGHRAWEKREGVGQDTGDGCCSAGSPAASPHRPRADQRHPLCCRVTGWCWDLPNAVQREGSSKAWGGNLGKAHSQPTEEPGFSLVSSVLSALWDAFLDLPLPSSLHVPGGCCDGHPPQWRGFSASTNAEALTKSLGFPVLVSPSCSAPAALLLANSSWKVLDSHYDPCWVLIRQAEPSPAAAPQALVI